MNILITGATGFIGKALVQKWLADKHQITILSRSPQKAESLFQQAVSAVGNLDVFSDLNEFDVVVNLAGEPIFDHRWTVQHKALLWQSRLHLTQKLTALINQSTTPPKVFISASATGFYGHGGEQELTENTPHTESFTGQLCAQWEQKALQANTRVCLLRTGIPLDLSGGALAKIIPFYRWGLGGKLGDGRQFMPWIALSDMINAIDFLVMHEPCQGAFNLCAPNPIRNAEFNQCLGSHLNRPHFMTVPAFMLKLVLGERACLVLDCQNTKPRKLQEMGFQFEFEHIEDWLRANVF